MHVRDVATVVDTYRETSSFVSISGVPGVAIGISRKSGSNVVELIEQVDATCEELNRIFAADDPELWARLEEGYQRLPETKEALRAGEREARKVGVNAVGRRRLMTMLRQALEQVQELKGILFRV